MSLARKLFLIFALLIGFQLVVLGLLLNAERVAEEHRARQTHSTERTLAAARLLGAVNDAQSLARAYTLSGEAKELAGFDRAIAKAPAALADLLRLENAGIVRGDRGAPNPARLARMRDVTTRAMDDLQLVQRRFHDGRTAEAGRHLESAASIDALDAFRRAARAYQAEELSWQWREHRIAGGFAANVRLQAIILVLSNAAAALLLLWYLHSRIASRLDASLQNMERLVSGQRLHPVTRTADEIGRLDVRFHGMAAQLEEARDTQRAQNEELARMNEEKNHFIGMAAHDLRNPLFGAGLATETLLRRSYLSEMDRAILLRTRTTLCAMTNLVNDFLNVSQIEAGELLLHRGTYDLAALACAAIESVRYLADQKQLDMQCDAPAAVMASFDAEKIGQVVTNFLTNAIKFSPPGSSVLLTITRAVAVARVSVEDHGPGIEAAELPRLFQPFARTVNRPTGGESSAGLGLAICRKIVDGHGGRIVVRSEVGRGSTFMFEIPAA